MAYNESHNEEPSRYSEAPKNINRRLFLKASASVLLATAISSGLAACTEAVKEPSPRPTENGETLSPTPTATPKAPEHSAPVQEAKGLNGEYFQASPSWQQEFSSMKDGGVDENSWNVLEGPAPANAEAERYTDSLENLRVQNGTLILQAQREAGGANEYTSARIDTAGKQDFQYGKFEITAKIPNGVGSWPAAWLLPSENKYRTMHGAENFSSTYVDGELDIIEAIGSQQNTMYGIAHALKNPDNPKYPYDYYNTIQVPDADTAYHAYGLEWTPTNLTFSVDGQVYYSVDKEDGYTYEQWPYDQKYHLIVNYALGGTWAGQDKSFGPDGVDDSKLPSTFELKSIKYFSYVPDPSK